jgi:hypothetical protein
MFKRRESSRLRQEFWSTFGKYMSPVPSAEGLKINWINYRTNIKDVYFRMDATHQSAMISISLEHQDPTIREIYFQQFQLFETLLLEALEEEWEWQPHVVVMEDKVISRIYKEITGLSIFNKEDWPALISFFKPKIIALDRFWEDARYSFEELKM